MIAAVEFEKKKALVWLKPVQQTHSRPLLPSLICSESKFHQFGIIRDKAAINTTNRITKYRVLPAISEALFFGSGAREAGVASATSAAPPADEAGTGNEVAAVSVG